MKKLNNARITMVVTALAVSSAFASVSQTLPFTPMYPGVPVLLIERVEQIDNLDQGDMFGKNNADFYAIVTVNGKTTKTKVDSKDDARPYWQIPLDMSARYSDVTVRIMDDDGGLERKDDHADINPFPNRKDIRFWYDRDTGRVSGVVRGGLKDQFVMEGGGDDDRARITFMVYKS